MTARTGEAAVLHRGRFWFLLGRSTPTVLGMTRENGADKDEPVQDPDPHMGEVPDKQLHRWKGEGGAMPPQPIPAPEDEDS